MSALLQSKYIYLMVRDILAEIEPATLQLYIAGQAIEINEFSLVHIENRHFARLIKSYDRDKSFHGSGVQYRQLPHQLKELSILLDQCGLLQNVNLDKFAVTIDGVPTLLYTSMKQKSLKGHKGPIVYRRLDTFFPIEEASLLKDLADNFQLVYLNERYSVYIPE